MQGSVSGLRELAIAGYLSLMPSGKDYAARTSTNETESMLTKSFFHKAASSSSRFCVKTLRKSKAATMRTISNRILEIKFQAQLSNSTGAVFLFSRSELEGDAMRDLDTKIMRCFG